MDYMSYAIKNRKEIKRSLLKKINYVLGARFCGRSLALPNFQRKFRRASLRTKSAGFTLIELIVAVFIFSILVTIAGGSFVSVLSLQKRALNIKKVEENGRFISELMARELRVANPINTADSSCPGSGISTLSFQHPVNGAIIYSLSGGQVHRSVGGVDSIVSNPDIEVSRLIFCISGNVAGDDRQPRVTIILGLKTPGAAADVATIDLQTTVSQRMLSD